MQLIIIFCSEPFSFAFHLLLSTIRARVEDYKDGSPHDQILKKYSWFWGEFSGFSVIIIFFLKIKVTVDDVYKTVWC